MTIQMARNWKKADLWVFNVLEWYDGTGCKSALLAGVLPQEPQAVLQHLWRLESFLDLHLAHAGLQICRWRPFSMP